MVDTQSRFRVVRFGAFEADLQTGELRKDGVKLKFSGQPFQVLSILLERPGELVTREELQKRLWPDTFVDVERNLNTAVNKIREVLGDSAESPRFLETLQRRGYRFIAPVENTGNGAAIEERTASDHLRGWQKPKKRRPAMALAALVVAAVLVVLLAVGVWHLSRPLPPPRITAYTQITHDGRGKKLGGTDGSRIYFTQASPLAIMQVGVNGGDATPAPITVAAPEAQLGDVSPDGSSALVFTNEQGHIINGSWWIASLLGGSARRLVDAENAGFSPDGLSTIFVTPEGGIFLARIDGTGGRKLAQSMVGGYSFNWSPDQKDIRFIQGGMLWEMASDGSGLHRLLPAWKEPGSPIWAAWTPDGRFYLFSFSSPSSGAQIWALDERRRLFGEQSLQPIRLTSGPVRWDRLVPSRDGTRILAGGVTLRGELSRIDQRTGTLQPFLGGISAEYVSFSLDGTSVAYVSFPERTLWKADRDGGNKILLASGSDYIVNPRWSPDSQQIVYSAISSDGHSAMYLISAGGGKPQRLLQAETAGVGDPNWSPEGKRVLFSQGFIPTSPTSDSVNQVVDLRILDIDSSQVTVVAGSSGMWSPRWSTDGRYVVAKWRDQRPALPIFDFRTQKWSSLPIHGDAEFLSFSHDSRYVYFLRFGRDQGVFRVPVAGSREERVVDMQQWHITGNFGFAMSLDPTDAPLVLRDVGSDDIYALTLGEK